MQPCWPPAVAQRRALVTENVAECVELHRTAVITGRRHFGLVFTSARGFPRTTRAIGRLVRALDALLDAHRTDDALATRPGGWSRPESSKAFSPRRAEVAAAPRWPPRPGGRRAQVAAAPSDATVTRVREAPPRR